jgi:hypothetical protein
VKCAGVVRGWFLVTAATPDSPSEERKLLVFRLLSIYNDLEYGVLSGCAAYQSVVTVLQAVLLTVQITIYHVTH